MSFTHCSSGFRITPWEAKPHTVAKVAILVKYLQSWFNIFGHSAVWRNIFYLDGFAGPGKYLNHHDGSPVVALRAAIEARTRKGVPWRAGTIHCVFVEKNQRMLSHLQDHLSPMDGVPGIEIHLVHDSFDEAVARLQRDLPKMFDGSSPLMAFIDPFGVKGLPFSVIEEILSVPRSEVLLNLNADAITRILHGDNASVLLKSIFSNDLWRDALETSAPFNKQSLQLATHYKNQLRSLPHVGYVYDFEMRTAQKQIGQVGYYLLFASQHHLGLEKMKEAMSKLDQMGDYKFSNAMVGQLPLIRFDQPEDYADSLVEYFRDQRVRYETVRDYALNETPFSTPRSMLRSLDMQGRIQVISKNPKRRRGTFKEEDIKAIEFREEGETDG